MTGKLTSSSGWLRFSSSLVFGKVMRRRGILQHLDTRKEATVHQKRSYTRVLLRRLCPTWHINKSGRDPWRLTKVMTREETPCLIGYSLSLGDLLILQKRLSQKFFLRKIRDPNVCAPTIKHKAFTLFPNIRTVRSVG